MINRGDGDVFFRSVVFEGGEPGYYAVSFKGESVSGNSGLLYVVNEYNHVLGESTIQAQALFDLPCARHYALLIKVFPHSEILVTKITVAPDASKNPVQHFWDTFLRGTSAVIVPAYPTVENKYPCAFVHARVGAYRDAQVSCDVICAFDYEGYCSYEFEGVRVLRMPMRDLSALLRHRRYRAILLHFFDLRYAQALDESNLDDTPILLWSHNPETRYWDWPLFTSPYFSDPADLAEAQIEEFKIRDEAIKRFNKKANVSWVFVSESLKKRSEELLGFNFERAHVIPNLVDDRIFTYCEKTLDLRKKVFLVRKFDDISTYALDIDVACILELSTRSFFGDMEFNLYGTGDLYDRLVAPLR
ncbi:MAG: hypothetical protein RR672_11810, partial [Raoultibacter sp.]